MLLDDLYIVLETFLRTTGYLDGDVEIEKWFVEHGIFVRISTEETLAPVDEPSSLAIDDWNRNNDLKIKEEEEVEDVIRNNEEMGLVPADLPLVSKSIKSTSKTSDCSVRIPRIKLSKRSDRQIDHTVNSWNATPLPTVSEKEERETKIENSDECVLKFEKHHPDMAERNEMSNADSDSDQTPNVFRRDDDDKDVGKANETVRSSRRARVQNSISDGDIQTCKECPMRLINQKEFLKHHLKCHIKTLDVYPCPHCLKKLSSKEEFRRHVRLFHPINKATYEKKRIKDPLKEQIEELSSVTGLPKIPEEPQKFRKVCNKCNLSFSDPDESRLHFYTMHHLPKQREGQAVNCPVCGEKFYHQKKMWNHQKLMHESEKYRHKCSQCDFTAKFPSRVRKHEKSNHGERKFQCLLCETTFFTQSDLNRHFDRVHRKLLLHQCLKCHKRFFHETALQRHDHAKHDWNCPSCAMTFVGKKDLVVHLKDEHGSVGNVPPKMRFKCSVCNKGFRTSKDCRKHNALLHRLGCEECPMKYVQRTELLKHWQELHCNQDGMFKECPQ